MPVNVKACGSVVDSIWRDRADQPFGFAWYDTLKINRVYFGTNSVYQNSAYAEAEGG